MLPSCDTISLPSHIKSLEALLLVLINYAHGHFITGYLEVVHGYSSIHLIESIGRIS